MTAIAQQIGEIDGVVYDGSSPHNPGLVGARPLLLFGQTANTSGSTVANQPAGTADLANVSAGTTGTVTVANSLVTAGSLIFLTVFNTPAAGGAGDVTAARAVDAWVESVSNGSFTIGYHAFATMSQHWSCNYLVIN
jgi:hypothetical protein